MLTFYFLFNFWAPENSRSEQFPALINKYKDDFDEPSAVSLVAHLASGQNPDWPLKTMEDLHLRYFRDRHHAASPALGRFFEAAFSLRLAEQNRAAGNTGRARELVGFAVECFPSYAPLQSFERSFDCGNVGEIDWVAILAQLAKTRD
jgi:hypothetical protein